MTRFSKIQVLSTMCSVGILPVFHHNNIDITKNVLKACYKGGIRIFEFTNRGEFDHEIFNELNRFTAKECPELILGIGSIVDAPTASLYIQLGANFIVGPLFNSDIAPVVNRKLIPYIPGCGSMSEIGLAQEAGCDLCKIFPGNVLGINFIKNIKDPMPWSLLMVTGGIKPEKENLKSWFDAGVSCVGIGSNFFSKKIITNKEWDKITTICSSTLTTVKQIKKEINERNNNN